MAPTDTVGQVQCLLVRQGFHTHGGDERPWRCAGRMRDPPRESDVATRRPSREGTYQSMVVLPLGSSSFGSRKTRGVAAPTVMTASIGCCLAGSVYRKKSRPPPDLKSR